MKYEQSSSVSFPSYRGTRKFGWKAGDVQRRRIPVHSVERLEPWESEACEVKITDPKNGRYYAVVLLRIDSGEWNVNRGNRFRKLGKTSSIRKTIALTYQQRPTKSCISSAFCNRKRESTATVAFPSGGAKAQDGVATASLIAGRAIAASSFHVEGFSSRWVCTNESEHVPDIKIETIRPVFEKQVC